MSCNIWLTVSKDGRVTTCLVICAIGVTLISINNVTVGAIVALLGAIAALYEFRRKEPPKLTDDQLARESAARRLDAIAQSALDLAASEPGENAFVGAFLRRWNYVEFQSLDIHLRTRFGLSVRDELLTNGPADRSRLGAYVSAMRETAERLRKEA